MPVPKHVQAMTVSTKTSYCEHVCSPSSKRVCLHRSMYEVWRNCQYGACVMRRTVASTAFVALLLLLLHWFCTEQASALVAIEKHTSRRSLIAAKSSPKKPQCSQIHRACKRCNQRTCSACYSGWKFVKGSSAPCECMPGTALNATRNGWCVGCKTGMWCPGSSKAPQNCPNGLETKVPAASSIEQCMPKPGFSRQVIDGNDGLVKTVKSAPCPVGYWNAGNKDTCTKCSEGVTTERKQSDAAADCKLAMQGYCMDTSTTAQPCPQGSYNEVNGTTAKSCDRCPAGLSTNATGATAAAQCLAPPGSFLEIDGTGVKCPKGSYTTTYNSMENCITCAEGATTSGEGSASEQECSLALKGYYLLSPNKAEQCPQGTYNDQEESTATACTACQLGLQTESIGATDAAACLAAPGYELKEGAGSTSPCDQGSFKEGYNMNSCTTCGTGLVTAGPAAANRTDCLVPAGMGLSQFTSNPWRAVAGPCTKNTYGWAEARPAAALPTPRCIACPQNMFTLDTWEPDPVASTTGYVGDQNCLVAPGWGLSFDGTGEVQAVRCEKGFYNEGKNLLECQACGPGLSTSGPGSVSKEDCAPIEDLPP